MINKSLFSFALIIIIIIIIIERHLIGPSFVVEDIAVEFPVPGSLLALEEDQRAEITVFVLLYQSPPPSSPHCVDTGQAG